MRRSSFVGCEDRRKNDPLADNRHGGGQVQCCEENVVSIGWISGEDADGSVAIRDERQEIVKFVIGPSIAGGCERWRIVRAVSDSADGKQSPVCRFAVILSTSR